MLTIDLRDPQNAERNEQERVAVACEGEADYPNLLTLDYIVGEVYIKTGNRETREFDMIFDIDEPGDVTYTIIWIDEEGTLFWVKTQMPKTLHREITH